MTHIVDVIHSTSKLYYAFGIYHISLETVEIHHIIQMNAAHRQYVSFMITNS